MTAGVSSHKRCPRCRQSKPAGAFYQRRTGRLSAWCQECTRAASHESRHRRRANPVDLERMCAVDRARQRRHRGLSMADGHVWDGNGICQRHGGYCSMAPTSPEGGEAA